MHEDDRLAARFEQHRSRLRAIAYRMLGSATDADDAVQNAWVRLSRTDADSIENLGSWLTTVVSRVCLNVLQARRTHPEAPLVPAMSEPVSESSASDPELETLLADSIGSALTIMLDKLSPPERVAFVLHDIFSVPFADIAPIVGRNDAATRQLASRARRRVQEAPENTRTVDMARQQYVVEAFLMASRAGNFAALLTVLDPNVVLRADETALQMGLRTGWITKPELHGADAVAEQFAGRSQDALLVLIDGVPGGAWAPGGTPRVAFGFTVQRDKVVEIKLIADPERLGLLDLVAPLDAQLS